MRNEFSKIFEDFFYNDVIADSLGVEKRIIDIFWIFLNFFQIALADLYSPNFKSALKRWMETINEYPKAFDFMFVPLTDFFTRLADSVVDKDCFEQCFGSVGTRANSMVSFKYDLLLLTLKTFRPNDFLSLEIFLSLFKLSISDFF